jgi:SAM-dependent methyltransferase
MDDNYINYDDTFYERQYEGSLSSAEEFFKILCEYFSPHSVIDFGCGVGAWLSVIEKFGADELVGRDGQWVDQSKLLSKNIKFKITDFEKKIEFIDKFDLAISVEVAEHFYEQHADNFVSAMAAHSDNIIFGAARPEQGGSHHVNLQPQSYWIKKFEALGYRCFDIFRPSVWNNSKVEYWYAQNSFFFTKTEDLIQKLSVYENFIADIEHPQLTKVRLNHSRNQKTKHRADILRDASLELEKEDINLAIKLMNLALKARPDGKFIMKKLSEYEALS